MNCPNSPQKKQNNFLFLVFLLCAKICSFILVLEIFFLFDFNKQFCNLQSGKLFKIHYEDWWYQKKLTSDASIMGRPDEWQQPIRNSSEEISSVSKTGRTRLEIISSWANSARPMLYCFGMGVASLFRNWGNWCKPLQRRLDKL